jgi:TatD DNase family protein
LIDIGVNLTNQRFDKDRDALIERARQQGIEHLIVTGTSVSESQAALALCTQYPDYLSSTAGVHPHDADGVSTDYIDILNELANAPAVKAIGECGLDFNRNFSVPDQQKTVFTDQVALASQLNMPLFLHQRDAFESWFDILSPYFDKIPAMVAHCFTGNKQQLLQCVDAGMYIGITGWVCDERRGQELFDIVKHIPLKQLMIETDAPYLTPRNIRPKPKSSRNEPSYLSYIVPVLARAMHCSEQDVIEYSKRNARQVFNLK